MELNCLFSWLCLSLNTCTLTSFLFSHDFIFTSLIWALYIFECHWLSDFHVFHGIYSYFIPYLKDFVLVFIIIFKLVIILQLIEFSKMLKLFSILCLKTHHPMGGWMGDQALCAQIENLFKQVHDREVVWVIHFILIVFSIGITVDIYFVYSYLFLYMYAST